MKWTRSEAVSNESEPFLRSVYDKPNKMNGKLRIVPHKTH